MSNPYMGPTGDQFAGADPQEFERLRKECERLRQERDHARELYLSASHRRILVEAENRGLRDRLAALGGR
jgi:hypothetical protein